MQKISNAISMFLTRVAPTLQHIKFEALYGRGLAGQWEISG
jgi:hypothetical protein